MSAPLTGERLTGERLTGERPAAMPAPGSGPVSPHGVEARPGAEVVLVSCAWPLADTGAGVAARATLEQLLAGFDRVWFLGPGDRAFKDAADWPAERVEWGRLPLHTGRPWRRFLASMLGSKPAITVRYRPAWRVLEQTLERAGAAAAAAGRSLTVTYEDVPPAVLMERVRERFPELRQAVRSHNIVVKGFADLDRAGPPWTRWAWRREVARIRRFEGEIARAADRFWAISDDDAAEYGARLDVEPHGVFGITLDADRYRDVSQGDPFTVVHVGSADLRKGRGLASFVAEAWPRVRAAIPNARLVLGGRGTEAFNDPALGVEGRGFVEDDRDVLASGALFVNPQMIGAGIKIKSIVAMLAGKTLVTTPTGIEGVAGEAGRDYVPVSDPAAMAEALIALLERPLLVRGIGTRARATARASYGPAALAAAAQPLLADLRGLADLPKHADLPGHVDSSGQVDLAA